MTTKTKARETVLAHLKKQEIKYEELDSEEKIYVISEFITVGKYEGKTREVYVVCFTTDRANAFKNPIS
jgi:hypothetical protein